MNLYISDMHFGHEDIIAFDSRPFRDTRHMDSSMISRWNKKVQDNDDVYIIGDVCYQNAASAESYLHRLKGKKHLIIGNHDKEILNNSRALKYFVDEPQQIRAISDERDGRRYMLCLCHYPLAEWEGKSRGYYHIYGHIHALRNHAYYYMSYEERALNAGTMINGYEPVSLGELIKNNRKFHSDSSL